MKQIFTIIMVMAFFMFAFIAMGSIMCAAFPTLYPAEVCK